VTRADPTADDACVVKGCGWYGTAYGSPPPKCGGYGAGLPQYPGCAFYWIQLQDFEPGEPELVQPYADWLAEQGITR
jgi:hypothetical protein